MPCSVIPFFCFNPLILFKNHTDKKKPQKGSKVRSDGLDDVEDYVEALGEADEDEIVKEEERADFCLLISACQIFPRLHSISQSNPK